MKVSELYAICDRTIGAYLTGTQAFRRAAGGEYVRSDALGDDRILVDAASGARHFSVLLAYYPKYMVEAEKAQPLHGEDRGFPCGPYLSRVGVGRREYMWRSGRRDQAEASMKEVLACLEAKGLPWLRSLRDPGVFAESVDTVAALYAAYANEVAGRVAEARALYDEAYRRLTEGMTLNVSEQHLIETIGREFVFVSRKLDRQDERVSKFAERLGYSPSIEPLDV